MDDEFMHLAVVVFFCSDYVNTRVGTAKLFISSNILVSPSIISSFNPYTSSKLFIWMRRKRICTCNCNGWVALSNARVSRVILLATFYHLPENSKTFLFLVAIVYVRFILDWIMLYGGSLNEKCWRKKIFEWLEFRNRQSQSALSVAKLNLFSAV